MFKASIFLGLTATTVALALGVGCAITREASESNGAEIVSSSGLVISQIFTGGGMDGAPFAHDYVELFNPGSWPLSLEGMSLQYADTTTAFEAASAYKLPLKTVPAGHYFLVQLGEGGGRTGALPAPDAIGPAIAMNETQGKLALVRAPLNACGTAAAPCPATGVISSLVTYGAPYQDGGTATDPLSHTTAAKRNGEGCSISGTSATDFTVGTPDPRNLSHEHLCQTSGADASTDAGDPLIRLNEVKVGSQGFTGSAWGYAEISCTKQASLAGYYFVVTDSSGVGTAVVDLGGPCGTNGLVYVKAAGAAGVRAADGKTTVLARLAVVDGGTAAAGSDVAFMIVKSSAAIPQGSDFDINDDGNADLPAGVSIVDGISLSASGATAPKYVPLFDPTGRSQAATRLVNDTRPNEKAAWYGGALKGGAESLDYDSTKASANLPANAVLTPGGPNFTKQDTASDDVDAGNGEDASTAPPSDVASTAQTNAAPVPADPPKPSGAGSVCAMSPGGAATPRFAAFAMLALALATLGRRRRSS